MSFDLFLVLAAVLLASVIMVGLLVRGLYRRCWAFLPYLLVVSGYDTIVWLAPTRHTWGPYLAKESLVAALKFLLAVELYARLFAGLPGVRRLANWPVLIVLTLTLLLLWTSDIRADPIRSFQTVIPIANDGTTLLLTMILALSAWFRVPAEPLHRAILRGFVPYLLIYTLGIHVFAASGEAARVLFNRVSAVSYNILLVFWGVAAWRPPKADLAPPGVVRRLRTWVSSS